MKAPPKLAQWTLRRLCSPEARLEVEGDLGEAFAGWAATRGSSFARRRYWREVAMLAGWRLMGAWRRFRDRKRPVRDGSTGREAWGSDGGSGWGAPTRNPTAGTSRADLLQDIRYGLRRLVKNPVTSLVAVLLLAIGVGGNATVFTVVEKVFMEPPPQIQNPEGLVGLNSQMGTRTIVEFGYYDYEFYRDHGEAFADVLAYGGFPGSRGRRTDGGGGEVVVGHGDAVEQAGAWVVSGNYFRVLGTSLALGTGFSPETEQEGLAPPEVILSHGFWIRSFGGDPSVLERPLHLNGVPFRVAGVTPRGFRGVNPGEPLPDLFIPILSAEAISRGFNDMLRRFQPDGSPSASRFLRLVARLAPGFDAQAAQAEAAVLQSRWEAEFSSWAETVYGRSYQLQISPEFHLSPFEGQRLRRFLFLLWFVVGSVFLIGCANLANLLLASAAGREREMGIRASLGANRRRLLAQLVTESLVLSVVGGLAGLAVAYIGAGVLTTNLPMNFEARFTPDASVVAFTLVLSTLAAVLFGTAPAWKLSRVDVAALIQRPGQARTRSLFRGGLVVGQAALSILLLIGGGLLARSVQQVQRVDLGFDPDRRLLMSVLLDNHGYSEEEGLELVASVLDRLAQVPGVRAASVSNRVPFLGSNTWSFTAPGTDYAEQGLQTGLNLIGPDYFEAMGIPVTAGRGFTRDDVPTSSLVAVVNETFAQRMWPGESPLGRTLDFFDQDIRVVGVSETSVYYNVTETPQPHVYIPSLQLYQGMMSFVVSTEPPVATMVGPVDEAMREFDPNLAVIPMSLADLVDSQMTNFRTGMTVVVAFAGIALFLALVGLYGVQSYLVARRTHEIGIRIALGAEGRSVVGSVVRSGLVMGGLGAVIGVGAALALSRLIRGFLFGVAPNDPVVFVTVPFLLLAACVAASLVPALRASRVNPVEALGRE